MYLKDCVPCSMIMRRGCFLSVIIIQNDFHELFFLYFQAETFKAFWNVFVCFLSILINRNN